MNTIPIVVADKKPAGAPRAVAPPARTGSPSTTTLPKVMVRNAVSDRSMSTTPEALV